MMGSSARAAVLSAAATLLALTACTSVPSADERAQLAQALAASHGWHRETLPTDSFAITAWLPPRIESTGDLVIYIEGDGLAWTASDTPSRDPTPLSPMALRLALAQPGGNAAYLARPCQYALETAHCEQRYWTSRRFAPEVIGAMNQATDDLKQRFRASRLILVGYSGGAAVAALLAARRTDVAGLVTVAGNLDHHAWTEWHRASPLTGSLNPADEEARLRRIPQRHFTGANDRIVPPALLEAFAAQMPDAKLEILEGYDHQCCWAENWPALWRSIDWNPPTPAAAR